MSRKIEQQMIAALRARRDWSSGDTRVTATGHVYLHGNHIATVGNGVQVNVDTLRRWPTPTTKSRLRALGVNVTTRNHCTYLNDQEI